MKIWFVVLLTVIVDQITKFAIHACLSPGQSLPVIPSVLHLTYVQNTGAAFGLFRGYVGLLVLVAGGTIAWIVMELLRMRRPPPHPSHGQAPQSRLMEVALALVLGGAAGNVIDRLRLGYVVDFIDVRVWPVFNLADSAITIGVGLLVWRALRRR